MGENEMKPGRGPLWWVRLKEGLGRSKCMTEAYQRFGTRETEQNRRS